ncbi:hypothetical protein KAX97_02980 [candidate division WOR-3 bacterium]|nr:hypothetical protein [candidate division WOR-3 bacterium]
MAKVPKQIQKYRITQKIEESNYAIIYEVYPVRESDLNHIRDKSLSGTKNKTRSRLRRGEVLSNGVKDPKGKSVVLKIAREKKDEYNELISREFQILAQFMSLRLCLKYEAKFS